MSKGSSSTPSSNTVVTQSGPPAQVLQAYEQTLGQAQNVASQPLSTYSGALVSGFTPDQMQAMQSVDTAQGVASPYINSAAQLTAAGSTPITPTALTGDQINQYLSPYLNSVGGSTEAQLANLNAQQNQQLVGNAVSAGAWGGDRSAIAQSELAGQQALSEAPTLANIYNTGYGTALSTAQQQQQTGVGAQEASGWLAENAGYGLGNLGNEALNTSLTGANAQLQTGGIQQELAQEQLNIPYEQYQQIQAYPFQTTSYLANIAEGLGSSAGGNSSTTYPGASAASQLTGLGLTGIAGVGLYNDLSSGAGGATAGLPAGGWRGGRMPHRDSGGGVGISLNGLPAVPNLATGSITMYQGSPGSGGGITSVPPIPNVSQSPVPQTSPGGGGGGIAKPTGSTSTGTMPPGQTDPAAQGLSDVAAAGTVGKLGHGWLAGHGAAMTAPPGTSGATEGTAISNASTLHPVATSVDPVTGVSSAPLADTAGVTTDTGGTAVGGLGAITPVEAAPLAAPAAGDAAATGAIGAGADAATAGVAGGAATAAGADAAMAGIDAATATDLAATGLAAGAGAAGVAAAGETAADLAPLILLAKGGGRIPHYATGGGSAPAAVSNGIGTFPGAPTSVPQAIAMPPVAWDSNATAGLGQNAGTMPTGQAIPAAGGAISGYTTTPQRGIPVPTLATPSGATAPLNINPTSNYTPPNPSTLQTTPVTYPTLQTTSTPGAPQIGATTTLGAQAAAQTPATTPSSTTTGDPWSQLTPAQQAELSQPGVGLNQSSFDSAYANYGFTSPASAYQGLLARGGRARLHRDVGGVTPGVSAGATSAGIPGAMGGNPIQQNIYSQLSSLPTEKLQELAVRMPPTPPQGQLVQRALQVKQMNPQAGAGTGAAAPTAQPLSGSATSPAIAPIGAGPALGSMARGGAIRGYDTGGAPGDEMMGVDPYSGIFTDPNGPTGPIPAAAEAAGAHAEATEPAAVPSVSAGPLAPDYGAGYNPPRPQSGGTAAVPGYHAPAAGGYRTEYPASHGDAMTLPPVGNTVVPTAGDAIKDYTPPVLPPRTYSTSERLANSPWTALLTAGLATMGGRSPYALQNLGQGSLAGIKTLEQQGQTAQAERKEQAEETYQQGELGESAQGNKLKAQELANSLTQHRDQMSIESQRNQTAEEEAKIRAEEERDNAAFHQGVLGQYAQGLRGAGSQGLLMRQSLASTLFPNDPAMQNIYIADPSKIVNPQQRQQAASAQATREIQARTSAGQAPDNVEAAVKQRTQEILQEWGGGPAPAAAKPSAAPAQAPAAPPTVSTQAQFDALPPGTTYTGTDGNTYRKP